ncbi:MAG TPA: hypothetical protein VLK35_02135 [Methylomirabilota bacterium]|nr:hypothetical protein [Methylomirabilota bacterium]
MSGPRPFRAGYEVVVEAGLQAATTPPRYAVARRCGHVHELLEAADRCLAHLASKPKWRDAVVHFAGSGVRADDWTELGPPPGVEPLSPAELEEDLERLRLRLREE